MIYTPTLTSAETLDIYAKSREISTKVEAVTQQQPSAGWFRLGAYTMTPGQNHRVEVAGPLEGETVADAHNRILGHKVTQPIESFLFRSGAVQYPARFS